MRMNTTLFRGSNDTSDGAFTCDIGICQCLLDMSDRVEMTWPWTVGGGDRRVLRGGERGLRT